LAGEEKCGPYEVKEVVVDREVRRYV